jgi:hypothetical protein
MLGIDGAVLLVGMGCLALASGVYDAIRARGRRGWAVVEAEIVDSQVVKQGTNFEPDWQAQVRYRYRVGGVQYERDWNSMLTSRTANFRGLAESEAKRFPLGARVRVQVSPEDPAFAVLETVGMQRIYGTVLVGVLVTAYGIYELAA